MQINEKYFYKLQIGLLCYLTVQFLPFDSGTFDMAPLGANFLHVGRGAGLTPAHVEAAVRHFGAPRK